MSTLLQSPGSLVAKKKAIPSVQVRVARDIADLAMIVAAYEGKQSSDLLSEILRPILQDRHAQHVATAAAKIAETAPKPKKGGA